MAHVVIVVVGIVLVVVVVIFVVVVVVVVTKTAMAGVAPPPTATVVQEYVQHGHTKMNYLAPYRYYHTSCSTRLMSYLHGSMPTML